MSALGLSFVNTLEVGVGHPLVEEFCRIGTPENMRTDFFRRCQRVFRDEVQPQLDERDRLLEENAALKQQLEKALSKRKVEAIA